MFKKIVIVAGEESGDQHAAELVCSLKMRYSQLQISGIGGHHMYEAGVELIYDLARYGVTGLGGIIRHASVIRRAFVGIKAYLEENKPDLLILVDYPGFNLRLAKFAKQQLNLRILYYISPQIWAWKANRIHTIKANIDHMAVILPFEKKIYESAGVPVSFVGHPLVKKIPNFSDSLDLRRQLNLPENKRLIAFLPGSRYNEIHMHLPVMLATMTQLNQEQDHLHFVIPIAGSLNEKRLKKYLQHAPSNLTLLKEQAIPASACSDCIVVASGTASLECALLAKPMCIVYKGSWLSYLLAMRFIRVRYLGLSNLLQNRMVSPELLQTDFNQKELVKMVNTLLMDKAYAQGMEKQLLTLKHSLLAENADLSLADLVINLLEAS